MTEYSSDERAIWVRTDPNSNGRWLYVLHPEAHQDEGDIAVGINRVYEKYLTPAEARAMAAALTQAADESDAAKPERDERIRRRREAAASAPQTSGYAFTIRFGEELQQAVMSQAAARAYPDEMRPLGDTVA
jgi:hypothetical protein